MEVNGGFPIQIFVDEGASDESESMDIDSTSDDGGRMDVDVELGVGGGWPGSDWYTSRLRDAELGVGGGWSGSNAYTRNLYAGAVASRAIESALASLGQPGTAVGRSPAALDLSESV